MLRYAGKRAIYGPKQWDIGIFVELALSEIFSTLRPQNPKTPKRHII
jgi:hypothetical protein